MKPDGGVVEVPAQRVGQGLRFVVVEHAGEVAPARVAAEFDHAGAEHDAELHPQQQPEDEARRRGVGGAEEDGEETGFEQNRFPAEAVEHLAGIDEREVQEPEQRPHRRRPTRPRARGPRRESFCSAI